MTGPITVPASGSVSMTWQAICHAANYNIYRELCTDTTCTAGNGWTLIGNYYTPAEATLPDDSSTDASPASTASVTGAGQQELTFTDTGASARRVRRLRARCWRVLRHPWCRLLDCAAHH